MNVIEACKNMSLALFGYFFRVLVLFFRVCARREYKTTMVDVRTSAEFLLQALQFSSKCIAGYSGIFVRVTYLFLNLSSSIYMSW